MPSDRVSITQEVALEYGGKVYSLLQGGEVRIDGVTVALPVMELDGVTIRSRGAKQVMHPVVFGKISKGLLV